MATASHVGAKSSAMTRLDQAASDRSSCGRSRMAALTRLASVFARRVQLAAAGLGVLAWMLAVQVGPALGDTDDSAEPFLVSVENGLLSVDLGPVALVEVLQKIAEQVGVEIRVQRDAGTVNPQRFDDLPLDQGIRRLVGRHSLLMLFGPGHGENAPARLRVVRVYAVPGEGQPSAESVFVPAQEPEANEGARQLNTEISERRERVVEVRELGASQDPADVPALVEILGGEPNAAVRRAAVRALARIGGPEAIKGIVFALHDDDRIVRVKAAETLGKMLGSRAMRLVQQAAARDPDRTKMAAIRTLHAMERDGFAAGPAEEDPSPLLR